MSDLGTGGWKGRADDDAAVATIHRALDSEINLIDTAPASVLYTLAGEDSS